MKKQGGGQPRRRDAEEPIGERDLFLLQERINDIDRRVRSLYRWGLTQRVIFYLKLLLFIIVVVSGVSAYNRYFPSFRNEFLEIYRQMRAGLDVFEGPESGFDFRQLEQTR